MGKRKVETEKQLHGRFGPYGGQYVPETLMRALIELEKAYDEARRDPAFQKELDGLLADYVGRPSPLYFAQRLTKELGGAKIYLKREDLNHTGAHKINNTLGQGLLARRMGKKRLIAETGAGQHGVATAVVACVGGGSNSIGIFHAFIPDKSVRLIGVEAAGRGLSAGNHAATLTMGHPGVLHGSLSYVLQDEDGQTSTVHSVSAGLDYPGVGPEHSWLKDTGRAEYVAATDQEAIDAFQRLAKLEGIIPALESAHAVAHVIRTAPAMPKDALVVVCLSGRGDKDAHEVARILGEKI